MAEAFRFGNRLSRGPRTIILLDELNLNFDDLAYARTAIKHFLDGKQPQQPIALMALEIRGLYLVQDFTTDPQRLTKAVSTLPPALGGRTDVDANMAFEHANRALAALEQIARAAVGYPYRLNVIWVTSGFPELMQPVASNGRSVPLSTDYIAGMRQVANLLLQSRMSLYSIDPAGVLRESSAIANAARLTAAEIMTATNSPHWSADLLLEQLTRDTGGRSYYNRNDVDQAIAAAIQDGGSAYTLAYSPLDQNFDGRYRKIEVRIDKPGMTAHTRQGYYAVNIEPPQNTKERNTLLKAALGSPLPYAGIHAFASFSEYDPGTRRFRATFAIQPRGLIWTEQTDQIVLMAAISRDNKILGSWSWQLHWKQSDANQIISMPVNEILPAHTHRLRIVIADKNADRIGTVDIAIVHND